MATTVKFSDAIEFWSPEKSFYNLAIETAESYFCLHGRRAQLIVGELSNGKISYGVRFIERPPSLIATALKVISYFTLILPLIFLTVKLLNRLTHRFHVDQGFNIYKILKDAPNPLIPVKVEIKINDLTQTIDFASLDDTNLHTTTEEIFPVSKITSLKILPNVGGLLSSSVKKTLQSRFSIQLDSDGNIVLPHGWICRTAIDKSKYMIHILSPQQTIYVNAGKPPTGTFASWNSIGIC